jgi:hypothetical protein
MKKYISLILLSLSCNIFAQLVDGFDDNDFTSNPTWFGQVSKFQATTNQLFLNGLNATDTAYLYALNSAFNNTEWAFDVNMSFDPSDNNRLYVYLSSNIPDISATNLSGWMLYIGENGANDGIVLQKINNGVRTTVARFGDGLFATAPNYSIRVRRNAVGLWSIAYKQTTASTDNFIELGTINDPYIAPTNSFGIACKYTTSNRFKFDFDNFYIGDFRTDITPPSIDSLVVVDNNTLKVYFNEDVQKTEAQTLTNYFVSNGIGNPNVAVLDAIDNSLVTLDFASSFVEFADLTLTTKNIIDLNDNALITDIVTPFIYTVINIPLERDVVVNEIMADPSPVLNGLPEREYIEVFNKSTKHFTTKSWKLKNESSTLYNFPNTVLKPNTHYILCKNTDSLAFSAFGNVVSFSVFPTFDNTGGDSVIIIDQYGSIIDAIFYDESFYVDNTKNDGGYSIEQINPFIVCNNYTNWTASNGILGGTPGTQNSVFNSAPDIVAPQIISTSVLNDSTVLLLFNEPLSATANTTTSFNIDNGLSVIESNFYNPNNTALVLKTNTIDQNILYLLTILNLEDCAGNKVGEINTNFGIGNTPNFNEIIISEIMANPQPSNGLPDIEYVELYNTTSKLINLKGTKLFDGTSASAPFGELLLKANEYVIVSDSLLSRNFVRSIKVLGVDNMPTLNNDGEALTLYNKDNDLVFNLTYDKSWYGSNLKAAGGWSLEMIDVEYPCVGANNWLATANSNGGTPASTNSVEDINPDMSSIEAIALIKLDDTTYQINFNEKYNPNALSSASFVIDNGIGSISVSPILPGCTSAKFILSTALNIGQKYTLTIQDLGDCASNTIKEGYNQLILGKTLGVEPGDIVINEILFNPKSDGFDFVELYNKSDKYLLLDEMIIAEADVLNEEDIIDFDIIEGTGVIIPPMTYLVLSENQTAVKAQYTTPSPNAFVDLNNMPNYPDDEGVVVLMRNDNTVLDKVHYDESWHFSLLDIVDGVSLERVNINNPSQDPKNWLSASQSVGFATPAGLNSTVAAPINGGAELSVYPEVFSPDQDGMDDILNISYNLDKPSYVANMYIINTSGKIVKQIYKNQLISQTGTTIWDGADNDEEKGRIGLYYVVLEIFDTEGKKKIYRKRFGLANMLEN